MSTATHILWCRYLLLAHYDMLCSTMIPVVRASLRAEKVRGLNRVSATQLLAYAAQVAEPALKETPPTLAFDSVLKAEEAEQSTYLDILQKARLVPHSG